MRQFRRFSPEPLEDHLIEQEELQYCYSWWVSNISVLNALDFLIQSINFLLTSWHYERPCCYSLARWFLWWLRKKYKSAFYLTPLIENFQFLQMLKPTIEMRLAFAGIERKRRWENSLHDICCAYFSAFAYFRPVRSGDRCAQHSVLNERNGGG